MLVAFLTTGCEPCRELRLQLGALDDRLASVVAVDADAEPEAIRRHSVEELPTLAFFKRGRELHRFRAGALPATTLKLLLASGQ